MNLPSTPVQNTAVSQPQFHDSHAGESASAAEFDRWTISLSAIDSFLRGKNREAVESIAERMCKRAEHQQGTKSFDLSNLEKDFGDCGLPVDSSQGCSKEQKVKIVTGLILGLQTEANSGVAERPLGNSFCALMKKSESSIAMQQLLEEVNSHFAGEPLAITNAATQGSDGKNDDSPGFSGIPDDQHGLAYRYSKQPVSCTPAANPAVTPMAPPPPYDGYSSGIGTRLAYLGAHIERLAGDQWSDDQMITGCRNQMQGIKAELASLEAVGLEHYAGKFTEVRRQFQELQVKDLHHRLDKLEQVNIGNSRDIQLMEREIARLSKCFSELGLVGDEERSRLVERWEALTHQLDEANGSVGVYYDFDSLITKLNDLKYSKLADSDQIVVFFNHIECDLRGLSVMIDGEPDGSQRTELLEIESQLRDLLNSSKKTIKRQRLDNIKQLIETQENKHDRGAALYGDMLEHVDKQIHDFKALVDKVKMDEHESALLKDLDGRQARLKLINHGVNGQALVSRAKSSNPDPAGDIIENLDAAERLITISESDLYGFSKRRAMQAKGYLNEAIAQCEKLRDKAQRNELLNRYQSMGTRLQKIEERRVEELINRANSAIDCLSNPVGKKEVREVESLFEEARLELKELSGSNDYTIRTGLLAKFSDLKKKLEPYKDNVSDSQQATVTSSDVKGRFDPLKKEFDDYCTEYCHKTMDLEGQLLRCNELGSQREQRLDKMLNLKIFYEDSLRKAKDLRLEKFAGKPAYDRESQVLTNYIDHIRTRLEVLENQISWLKQKDEESHEVKRSGCKQS